MTDRRHDPQGYAEIERAKLLAACSEFRNGTISDDVFRACLKARGFAGENLRLEFQYHDEFRHTLARKATP